MAKYKILIALLSGGGVAAFLVLLLNVHALIISVVASMLLFPGGALATFLSRSSEFSPPLAVLAANAFVYSVAAFIVVVAFSRNVKAATLRLTAIRLTVPVLILVGLACVPAFNPLWPRGMAELTKQEKELQEALPLGMGLNQARAVLLSKGIQSQEQTETSGAIVLKRKSKSITANPGDRVVLARLETGASRYPCSYEIEMVLLFGQDDRLKQQYVQRLRQCP